jgi:hypothetical protein
MRRLATGTKKEVENLECALSLEKKWLLLAIQGKIRSDTEDICNQVLLKYFPNDKEVLESSVESGTIKSSDVENKGDDIATALKKKRKREEEKSTSESDEDQKLSPIIPVVIGVPVLTDVPVEDDSEVQQFPKRLKKSPSEDDSLTNTSE